MSRFAAIILGLCCLVGMATEPRAAVVLGDVERVVSLGPQVLVFEDPEGTLGIEDVQRREGEFRASGVEGATAINFGYSASAWWLRIDLAAAPSAPRDWLLDVAFPTLDSVEYYGPDGTRMATGDRLPFFQRPLLHRNFVFPVRLGEEGTGTIWLRVVSEGTLTIPLRLWRQEAFWQDSLASYSLLSLYFGMLLALASYNLLLWFLLRDHNYLSYVMFAVSMGVGQLSLNGLGNEFLWPEWPAWGNLAFSTGFAATGLFGALFTRGFLETRRHMPRLDGAIVGLAGLFSLCAVAPLLLPYRLAAIMTSLTGVTFSIIAVVAGVSSLRAGRPGARVFLLAWSALLVGVVIVGLRNLNLLPTTFLSFYALQIGSAIEMVLLSFGLAERISELRREKDAVADEVAATRKELAAVLVTAEADVDRRVAERTTELEALTARLRESQRDLQSQAHADPLTGLANRLLLDARLEQAMQHVRRGYGQIALMLLDLDAFKDINDQHGRAIGDELLRLVGARLKGAVREVDTVARIGGDEFVVVLSNIGSASDAEKFAAKLVRGMREPGRVLGMPVECSASVGVAMFGGGDLSPAELLRRADQALFTAKEGGRNGYRMFSA